MRYTLLSLLVVSWGCQGQGSSAGGDVIGVFEADGILVEQTCGEVIEAPALFELDFTLSVDPQSDSRAYMDTANETFPGWVSESGYTFEVWQSWTVVEVSSGNDGCIVTQVDTLSFIVEYGGGDGGFSATDALHPAVIGRHVAEFVPAAGSDCGAAISSSVGAFLTLPCRVEYVVTGEAF